MVVGLVAVAAVTGVVASSAVREAASSYYEPQSSSLSAAMRRDELYSGMDTIMAHNEYTSSRGELSISGSHT